MVFSRMKTLERAEARRLRHEEGLSIREITSRLGVAKSSVSAWVRDVLLTAEQRARLQARDARFSGQCLGAAANARKARAARARGLPPTCLRKSTVNVYSKYSQKKRRNLLPYGTCKVCVHRTQIVQTIYGAIQEYGGFERPEWLD
jgi:transposase-like protein